ncbi:diguanylate cyclase [Thalassotalea sp. ND16A]|uniref:diguanylate cyclase n=1 Tax=Thalassotalea sp. ND16A TaxID=1535422 RepID=UPI00051CD543|nr:diguanylate cyclase [Thalassotalea sp. ND16A]KGJ89357.1 putative diguanylate cyclase [Thalassotalea sp. ND16A]
MKTFSLKYSQEQLKPLLFVLFVSVLGFVINLYPIPLFTDLHLIIGNAAFVVVAMRFGVLYSLLSALIVTTAFVISFSHPFGYLTFGLEAIVIALFRRKGWYILYADVLYWLFIGMPLTALILFYFSDMSEQVGLLTLIKQAFNGLFYTSIAGLIVYFFPKTFAFTFRQQPRVLRTFKAQLVYATSLVITFSIMATSIFVTKSVLNSQHKIIEKNIVEHKQYLQMLTENFIAKHVQVIEGAANSLLLLGNVDKTKQQQLLLNYHRYSPDFRTMFLADNKGNISASSPQQLLPGLLQSGETPNVSFREYFQANMSSNTVFISKAIRGKGFGDDPIVSISKPFYLTNNPNADGIVQGSINLSNLAQIIPENLQSEFSFVISDAANSIIYASKSLNLEVLNVFEYKKKQDITFKNTGLVALPQNANPENADTDYFLTKGKTQHGWNLYVLFDSKKVIASIEREYLLTFTLLFFAFLIAIALAQRVGKQVTRPLKFIMKQLQQFEVNNEFEFKPLYSNSSKEIVLLYDELQRNKNEINEHKRKLEDEVAQRTNELKLANDKLTQLAQKDGLTGIFNRRYFDENFSLFQKLAFRNKNSLAVAMLDLDNFKDINDVHGHLTGDQCLRLVSETLSIEFSRATDLIARYGGEEFILVINQISEQDLLSKLEKLRTAIAELVIYNENQQSFKVTASIGAVLAPASFSRDAEQWIKIADLCLYKAKNSGRNTIKLENFTELL